MDGDNEERSQQEQIDEAVDALQKGRVQAPPAGESEREGEGEEPTPEPEETGAGEATGEEEIETPEEELETGEDRRGEEPEDEPVDPRIAKLEAKLEQTEQALEDLRSQRQEETEERSDEPVRFIESEEEAEELLNDPMKLNDLLNRVLQKGRELAMKDVPPAVLNSVNRTMTIKDRAQEFYREHPELAEHKEFVGYIANSLSHKYSDDPEGLDKLFAETAKEAKRRLNIKSKAKNKERQRRRSGEDARFARKPGAGRQPEPDQRTDQQKQIDQMIDELGR